MSGARTEQPTPRRLREARRRGEVAISREASGLGALLAGAAALAATAPSAARALALHLRATLAEPAGAPAAALLRSTELLVSLSAPVLLAAAGGALAAGLLQTRGLLAPAAVFRTNRLDPLKNLRAAFAPRQLGAVLLSAAKALLALALAADLARRLVPSLAGLPRLGAASLLTALPRLLLPLALRLALLLAAFAALDLALARRRHARSLRMTREEVRREQKEDEGDPHHRAERRRRHRALVEAAPIARATCVVVNPTRLAVALLHDRAAGAAPLVVAKGAGAEAARIRAAARRAGVPVVRDVPLARALWRLADLGEEIPEELYEAAAAVLVNVHGLSAEVLP